MSVAGSFVESRCEGLGAILKSSAVTTTPAPRSPRRLQRSMTSERRLWLNSLKILTVSCSVLTVVTGMFGWPPDRSLPNTTVCPRCGAAPCRRCCSPASLQRVARVQSGVTSVVPPCLLPEVSLSFSFHQLRFPLSSCWIRQVFGVFFLHPLQPPLPLLFQQYVCGLPVFLRCSL